MDIRIQSTNFQDFFGYESLTVFCRSLPAYIYNYIPRYIQNIEGLWSDKMLVHTGKYHVNLCKRRLMATEMHGSGLAGPTTSA